MGIDTAVQNLNYIQKKLLDGSYKKDMPLMQFALSNAIESIRNTPFNYVIRHGNTKDKKGHISSYTAIAQRYKAKALCDLEDLQGEMSTLFRVKRCLVLIKKLLETNFYRNYVQQKMENFIFVANRNLQASHQHITKIEV
ncbi:hypothetical protein [Sporosarcina aquimarina]|uniref:hypothetical protein n=1 Tax=Sporosarcina aquimarina TaxID=114975 RepID=UPI001C8DC4BE|nr:hypothetical protein [Sporosarcina aquimarina]MBY0224108.1 hypothetical protein [Sporosarcina aquimarina]